MNEFRQWMQEAGFNFKQVTMAGEAIGLGETTTGRLSLGTREITDTERLAMAAYLLGVEPWPKPQTNIGLVQNAKQIRLIRKYEAEIEELKGQLQELRAAWDAAVAEAK